MSYSDEWLRNKLHYKLLGREMSQLMNSNNDYNYSNKRHTKDLRSAKIILMLALHYFIAWTPYAVVSLIGQFGPDDYLTPVATSIAAFLGNFCRFLK